MAILTNYDNVWQYDATIDNIEGKVQSTILTKDSYLDKNIQINVDVQGGNYNIAVNEDEDGKFVNENGEITITSHLTPGFITTQTADVTLQLPVYESGVVTPTENEQILEIDNKYAFGNVTIQPIPKDYVGTEVPRKSASNIQFVENRIDVPAGYYPYGASQQATNGSLSFNDLTVDDGGLVTASVDLIRAGWISSTPGQKTLQLPIQSDTYITPGRNDKIAIAPGLFTVGSTTIKGDSNLIPENIKKGVNIFGVEGTCGQGDAYNDLTNAYGIIIVYYSKGSRLMCTNGIVTYIAGNTYGAWAFGVPSAGEWTIKATNGSQSKSETVEITTEGQIVTVEVLYELIMVPKNDYDTFWTGGVSNKTYGSYSITENGISLYYMDNGRAYVQTSKPIPCTAGSVITINVSSFTNDATSYQGKSYLYIANSTPSGVSNLTAYTEITSTGKKTLLIGSAGSYYIGILNVIPGGGGSNPVKVLSTGVNSFILRFANEGGAT